MPSSKVVGDLNQFIASPDISFEDVYDRAAELLFLERVFQYLRGEISAPPGFPEPL